VYLLRTVLRTALSGTALSALLWATAGFAHAETGQVAHYEHATEPNAQELNAQKLSAQELSALENEPPFTRDLIQRAAMLVRDERNIEGRWQAAKLYCEASRQGSAEGQFRLGMLYAAGQGVPKNQDAAAALFTTASIQGHYEAQRMLETVQLNTHDLPPCVLADVAPEKALFDTMMTGEATIDRYIANLPNNKRWVLGLVDTIATWYKVDAKLVLSIISVESNFATLAQSNKQAQGLMQLIPATAERFNVKNAFDASQNIKGGVAYLRWLLAYFEGDVALAVAAYNAGEGAVNKFKGVPPYAETTQYVKKVQARYPAKTHPYDANITEPSPMLKHLKRQG
jgi:soluble lytic murein transglycosylase-like protein